MLSKSIMVLALVAGAFALECPKGQVEAVSVLQPENGSECIVLPAGITISKPVDIKEPINGINANIKESINGINANIKAPVRIVRTPKDREAAFVAKPVATETPTLASPTKATPTIAGATVDDMRTRRATGIMETTDAKLPAPTKTMVDGAEADARTRRASNNSIEVPSDAVIIINRGNGAEVVTPKELEVAPPAQCVYEFEGVTLTACTPLVIRRLQTEFGTVTTIQVGEEAIAAIASSAEKDIIKRDAGTSIEQATEIEAIQAEMEAMMAEMDSVRRVMSTDDAEFNVAPVACVMVVEGLPMPCADIKITKREAGDGSSITMVDIASIEMAENEEPQRISGTIDAEGNIEIIERVNAFSEIIMINE